MHKYKIFFTFLLFQALAGCEWADNLGKHLPVIGERCESWQCFTESGKQASEAKKRQENPESSEVAPGPVVIDGKTYYPRNNPHPLNQ